MKWAKYPHGKHGSTINSLVSTQTKPVTPHWLSTTALSIVPPYQISFDYRVVEAGYAHLNPAVHTDADVGGMLILFYRHQ